LIIAKFSHDPFPARAYVFSAFARGIEFAVRRTYQIRFGLHRHEHRSYLSEADLRRGPAIAPDERSQFSAYFFRNDLRRAP
jgi:hypothetical protein